jgi:DNA polymerase IIIc chi subunit
MKHEFYSKWAADQFQFVAHSYTVERLSYKEPVYLYSCREGHVMLPSELISFLQNSLPTLSFHLVSATL